MRPEFSERRAVGSAIAVALTYLLVAWVSAQAGLVSRIPLYDGLAGIPPYRWVNPPEERLEDNEVPRAERFKVEVSTSGQADPGSVTTSDGQATLTFNYLPPSPQPYSFTLRMTPLDPAELAPPPGGYYFDGNAYRLEAIRDGTGTPVDGNFTSILRFSVHALQILALVPEGWVPLPEPLMTDADLQVSSDTPANGTFVPAGTGTRPPEGRQPGRAVPVGEHDHRVAWSDPVVGFRSVGGSSKPALPALARA